MQGHNNFIRRSDFLTDKFKSTYVHLRLRYLICVHTYITIITGYFTIPIMIMDYANTINNNIYFKLINFYSSYV